MKIIANSERNIYPVVDADGNFKAVVILADVRKIIFKPTLYDTTYIEEIMFVPELIIKPKDHVADIIKKFKDTSIYNIPVVEHGKYLGFISRANIFSAYRKMLQEFSAD